MRKAKTKKNSLDFMVGRMKLSCSRNFSRSGRASEIAERIGRPLTAVRQKAYDMGIKTRESRLWSASEVQLLKELYPNEDSTKHSR